LNKSCGRNVQLPSKILAAYYEQTVIVGPLSQLQCCSTCYYW